MTVENDLFKLDFTVCKLVRYHSKRQAFFENSGKAFNVFNIVAGSATCVGVLGTHQSLAAFGAMLIAIFAAVDLVVGFDKKARQYESLKRRYIELQKCMRLGEETLENLKAWTSERLDIQRDEPHGLTALEVACANEESIARGIPGNVKVIDPIQRCLKQYWSYQIFK